jgi:hypothetical protein
VSLFRGRANDSLTAFANEQIKAASTAAGGAPGTGSGPAGADNPAWAPLATVAVDLFTAVRTACTQGDLTSVSGRIGADLLKSLIHQQETMAAGGKRRVTRIDQVAAEAFNGQVPGPDDRMMIVKYRVSGGLGEATLGDDLQAQLAVLPGRSWIEIWRLARPEDAPALALVATCPNCGAPGNGLAACRYCSTSLTATATDYAVQTIEWLA